MPRRVHWCYSPNGDLRIGCGLLRWNEYTHMSYDPVQVTCPACLQVLATKKAIDTERQTDVVLRQLNMTPGQTLKASVPAG